MLFFFRIRNTNKSEFDWIQPNIDNSILSHNLKIVEISGLFIANCMMRNSSSENVIEIKLLQCGKKWEMFLFWITQSDKITEMLNCSFAHERPIFRYDSNVNIRYSIFWVSAGFRLVTFFYITFSQNYSING
jgi:hypothetical protein